MPFIPKPISKPIDPDAIDSMHFSLDFTRCKALNERLAPAKGSKRNHRPKYAAKNNTGSDGVQATRKKGGGGGGSSIVTSSPPPSFRSGSPSRSPSLSLSRSEQEVRVSPQSAASAMSPHSPHSPHSSHSRRRSSVFPYRPSYTARLPKRSAEKLQQESRRGSVHKLLDNLELSLILQMGEESASISESTARLNTRASLCLGVVDRCNRHKDEGESAKERKERDSKNVKVVDDDRNTMLQNIYTIVNQLHLEAGSYTKNKASTIQQQATNVGLRRRVSMFNTVSTAAQIEPSTPTNIPMSPSKQPRADSLNTVGSGSSSRSNSLGSTSRSDSGEEDETDRRHRSPPLVVSTSNLNDKLSPQSVNSNIVQSPTLQSMSNASNRNTFPQSDTTPVVVTPLKIKTDTTLIEKNMRITAEYSPAVRLEKINQFTSKCNSRQLEVKDRRKQIYQEYFQRMKKVEEELNTYEARQQAKMELQCKVHSWRMIVLLLLHWRQWKMNIWTENAIQRARHIHWKVYARRVHNKLLPALQRVRQRHISQAWRAWKKAFVIFRLWLWIDHRRLAAKRIYQYLAERNNTKKLIWAVRKFRSRVIMIQRYAHHIRRREKIGHSFMLLQLRQVEQQFGTQRIRYHSENNQKKLDLNLAKKDNRDVRGRKKGTRRGGGGGKESPRSQKSPDGRSPRNLPTGMPSHRDDDMQSMASSPRSIGQVSATRSFHSTSTLGGVGRTQSMNDIDSCGVASHNKEVNDKDKQIIINIINEMSQKFDSVLDDAYQRLPIVADNGAASFNGVDSFLPEVGYMTHRSATSDEMSGQSSDNQFYVNLFKHYQYTVPSSTVQIPYVVLQPILNDMWVKRMDSHKLEMRLYLKELCQWNKHQQLLSHYEKVTSDIFSVGIQEADQLLEARENRDKPHLPVFKWMMDWPDVVRMFITAMRLMKTVEEQSVLQFHGKLIQYRESTTAIEGETSLILSTEKVTKSKKGRKSVVTASSFDGSTSGNSPTTTQKTVTPLTSEKDKGKNGSAFNLPPAESRGGGPLSPRTMQILENSFFVEWQNELSMRSNGVLADVHDQNLWTTLKWDSYYIPKETTREPKSPAQPKSPGPTFSSSARAFR